MREIRHDTSKNQFLDDHDELLSAGRNQNKLAQCIVEKKNHYHCDQNKSRSTNIKFIQIT